MGKPRILVIRGGAIGDFVMTLPALEALRDRWAESYIEVLGYPHIAALAVACGLADAVTSIDRSMVASLFVPEKRLSAEMELFIRSFDVIVNYLYDPDDSVRSSLRQAGARQVLSISPRPVNEPAARHLMKPLEEVAIYPENEPYPRLKLSDEPAARGRETMSSWRAPLVIHPGSGSPRKNWPIERFLEIAEMAAGSGFDPVFSFGEADFEAESAFSKKGSKYPTLRASSLVDLAGALAASAGYVGNDSGVTHIAAAVGIPVAAVFGPSDPEVWASRSPRVRIIRSEKPDTESLAAVSADVVWRALNPILGARA